MGKNSRHGLLCTHFRDISNSIDTKVWKDQWETYLHLEGKNWIWETQFEKFLEKSMHMLQFQEEA